MKKIQITLLFLYSLLCFPGLANTTDDNYEEVKTIRKAFKINEGTELDIENKYGDIIIDTWEKDSISFTITIKVVSDSEESSNEILEYVDVDFYQSEGRVTATTEWSRYNSKIKATAIDIATALGRERKVVIDYHVLTPENVNLDIENKFGDIVISDFSGDIKLDAAHGYVKLRKAKKISDLTISYGKLRIREFEKASITIKSSDADLGYGKKLTIHSTASKIEIEQVDQLKIYSKHGRYEIEEVGSLDIYAGWSDFEIQKVTGPVTADIKYGELDLEKIAVSFQDISLTGSFADIELYFPREIAFNYKISLINGKRFSIPSEGNTTTTTETIDNIKEYEGTFATMPIGGKPANVDIKVKASYVDIRLID